MTRDEHMRAVKVVGAGRRYKRYGLHLMCTGPDCGGAEMFTEGHGVAAVVAAASAHIDEAERVAGSSGGAQ